MELTSRALRCYAALDFQFTRFSKSAIFVSPTVHFISVCLPRTTPWQIASLNQQTNVALLSIVFSRRIERVAQSAFLPIMKHFGKIVTLICLVFGCNYQPRILTRPFPLFSHIVSLLCFAFLIVFLFFVPLSVFWFQRIEEEQAWLSRLR